MTITYEYEDALYVNLTNRCNCNCEFCLRHGKAQGSIYTEDSLWLEHEPSRQEAMDSFLSRDVCSYREIVFCGYGEPTYRLDDILWLVDQLKARFGDKLPPVRINTNGHANLILGRDVCPELKGRMTGMSFRVPTNDVSVVDLTARLIHPASYHDVCVAMRNAAKNSMKGIITCTTDQVVSSDLTGFSETCIFDETAGIMLDDDFVKLIAWYDNEWGYTSKLLDLMAHMYEVDHQ